MPADLAEVRDQTNQLDRAVPVTRRRFLSGGLALATGTGLYSNQIARHDLELTQLTVFLRDLPHAFDGFRVVQLSDLHCEEFSEHYFLRRTVARVNALAADLVLVTGDFISAGPHSYAFSLRAAVHCAEILAELRCPLRFGCLGNHDSQVGGTKIIERIRPSGLTILANGRVPIERGSDRIWIAALDDPAHGAPDVSITVPPKRDGPVLLMVHEPDYATDIALQAANPNIDLLLSGHSHGGQICLPGGFPLTLPPGAKTFYRGLYHLDQMQLYVNRGVGTVGIPFRLNCPPEITLLTLRSA